MSGWWPQIRAVLVAVHLFAVTMVALPAPGGGMNRSAWKEPTVRDELDTWYGRFEAMGFQGSRQEFEDWLYEKGELVMEGRKSLLKPFNFYFQNFGTWQSWRMFVAPHTYPAVLHIEIRENGEWRKIYVERSDEFTWKRREFENDRFRSAIFRLSWPGYRKTYQQFGEWAAKEVGEEFPEATEVRLTFERGRTLSAKDLRDGKKQVRKLDKYLTKKVSR